MIKLNVFDGRSAPPPEGGPIVSIRKRGTLGLNEAAYQALGRPDAVKIVYGTEERVVGFMPASIASLTAYPVKVHANGTSYEVAGTKFCRFYGIPIDEPSRRYAAFLEGKALLIRVEQNDTGNDDSRAG